MPIQRKGLFYIQMDVQGLFLKELKGDGCNDPGKGTGRSPRAATADGLHREVVHAGIEETESQMGRSVAQCKVETWALPTGRVFQQPLPNPRAEKK